MRESEAFGYTVKLAVDAADDWKDNAACAGMQTTEIPTDLCAECDVKLECGMLWRKLNDELLESTRGSQRLAGVWGGERKAAEPREGSNAGRPKTNVGACVTDGCVRGAVTLKMCSLHYQRDKKARAA